MNFILWLILGAIAGWLAGLVTGTRRGLLSNIIVGVVGAFVGGWVFSIVGGEGISGFNIYSLLVAVVGAILLIVVVRAFSKG